MDLQHQEVIKELAQEHGAQNVLVLLGSPDWESAELSAETVVLGDPTYAGPLAEVQLGLPVYHVLEDEIRAAVPADVYEEQIGVMADVLEKDEIARAVKAMREKASHQE
jgi:anthranilate phosphoribosyltransferase